GTSRGKRRGARGARGAGELRRSQRISKAPAQGRGKESEDEGEDEEEEVLLTSTQQKALQTNKPHLFNKPNKAKRPNKPNKPHLFNKPNKAKRSNEPNNCLPKPIHYNNFNNFNFNKASKAKQPLLVAKCLPPHHLHRYSSTQMTEKSLY